MGRLPTFTPAHRSASRLQAVGIIALLAGSLSGCAAGKYRAASLPLEWQATAVENAQTLELAKIASPTVQTDRIGRGDVLKINISTGFNTENNPEWVVRVSDDGDVLLPDLGDVPLEGLELEAAEAQIGSLCREKGLYRLPQVTVTMEQPKINNVMVIGAVKEPNTYELRSGSSSLLEAIVKAGGLSEDAGTVVEIRHPGFRGSSRSPRIAAAGTQEIWNVSHEEPGAPDGPQTVKVDLISATQAGRGGYDLPDGSIVNVQRHDPLPIHVAGLVKKAGAYEFPIGKELTLLDAIAEAEGISNPLANKVYIIRNKPGHDEPILIEASLRKAKHHRGLDNPLLIPGDYVSVEQTPGSALYEAARLVGFGINGRAF
ncbi:MAG: SLBB domain-containing protein [Planctomycetaceae bacterium]